MTLFSFWHFISKWFTFSYVEIGGKGKEGGRSGEGNLIMEQNNNYYHQEQDNNPNLDELEDEQILSHINAETLSVSCYLRDDAFSGT